VEEMIAAIERYIYIRKGVRVKVALPDTPERWQLFWAAYFVAKTWTGTSPSEGAATD
jgi:hypothetical protein